MNSIRAAYKLLRWVLHMLRGLWIIKRQFAHLSEAQREAHIRLWALELLRLAAIKLVVNGTPAARGPVLVVANHISWLDILVIDAVRPCRFVSRADVKHWPVVGALVAGAGTLFIEREKRRDAMRIMHHMSEHLRMGHVLAVFPEGTTSEGHSVAPFHANLLQSAISAGAPVQPLAISYRDAATQAISTAPSYAGDVSLLTSMWRTLRGPQLEAHLHYGPPQPASGRERRAWAQALHDEVEKLRLL
jgi:1-acyl-sn-glycerol-3-phosphate acyltransferase